MVFVTGASGMLGSRLVFDLVTKGEEVFALYRNQDASSKLRYNLQYYTSSPDEILAKITWVHGDILDIDCLLENIKPGMEVYHCAAAVSFNPSDKNNLLHNNIEGTANLVNACLQNQVKKLCHVSSIGALGSRTDNLPVNEETPWVPDHKSPYSVSKYLSELEVWRGIAEGLPAVIVNPAVILGPANWQQGSPEFISRVAKGMKYYTLGTTSFVDVRDVSRAMILLTETEISAQRFILTAETMSYQNLFYAIADALGVERPEKYASPAITSMAWKAERLLTFFTRSNPRITAQTHKAAHAKDAYTSSKFIETTGFSFTPLSETIGFVANAYRASTTT